MTSHDIDYKTHILIGIRANGVMTVIRHWGHLPRQAEVQSEIEGARDVYVGFALCTPTSILPGSTGGGGSSSGRFSSSRGTH